nr:MAG TPA: hypothetical protein [Bacteriophage sp.]
MLFKPPILPARLARSRPVRPSLPTTSEAKPPVLPLAPPFLPILE